MNRRCDFGVIFPALEHGERCTIHNMNPLTREVYGFHGRTGTVVGVHAASHSIRLDGSRQVVRLFENEFVPESRNYDYEWQRERGLL